MSWIGRVGQQEETVAITCAGKILVPNRQRARAKDADCNISCILRYSSPSAEWEADGGN